MRYIFAIAMAALLTFECKADELDRFNQLYEVAVNNYGYVMSSNSSALERQYLRVLTDLKEAAAVIAQRITGYNRYEEIRDIKLKKYCTQLIGSFNAVRVSTKTSRVGSERDRAGALFMLYTYSNSLKEYNYPGITISRGSSAEKYVMLLEKFTDNVEMIYDDELSDTIKDHVHASYRRFSKHARTLQSKGMKHGFSITKYLNRATSAINSQRIGGKHGDSRGELYSAIQQLASFAAPLASEPVVSANKMAAPVSKGKESRVMREKLNRYRKEVINSDVSTPGLSYQPETIDRYLETLSRTEYRKFKRELKRYIEKGYSVDRAKTTAVKKIHSYTLAGLNKISENEAQVILEILSTGKAADDLLLYASPNAKITRM